MYGLKKDTFYKIINTLKRYANEIEKVFLFGSRARGDYKVTSDIDLAIKFRKNEEILYRIIDDLSEENIIYTFDVISYNKIHNKKLEKAINTEGIVIFLTDSNGKVRDTMNKVKAKLADLEKALIKLEESLARDASQDDLVIDATIQRFEFTYELSWKLMKSYLEYNGNLEATSPRRAIKESFKEGLIQEGEVWLQMLEDRNRTPHTYDEEIANEIYQQIKAKYFDQMKVFVANLKTELSIE